MNPRVVKRCTDCKGEGSVPTIVGERYCAGQGGPYEPIEEWRECDECDGTGKVEDLRYHEWAWDLSCFRLTCKCGWSGQCSEFEWWGTMGGFQCQCPTCDSSLLIPMRKLNNLNSEEEAA